MLQLQSYFSVIVDQYLVLFLTLHQSHLVVIWFLKLILVTTTEVCFSLDYKLLNEYM